MKDFLKSVETALTELVTLQIVTAVGDVSVTIDKKMVNEIDIAPGNAAMVSRLNLLSGDITTSMDKQFVMGDYTSLQEYHLKREEDGQNQIKSNIETLKELINLAREVDKEQKKQVDTGA